MKRFLLEVAAFLALQAVMATGFEALYQRLYGARHYLRAFEDKSRLLEARRPPRILLVGGSSLAFGADSAAIERAIGRPVVNMGVHAGLGLDLMLGQVEEALAPGDVVVISPEYGLFRGGRPMDSILVLQLLRNDPRLARQLPAAAVPQLLDDGLFLPSQRLQALWDHAWHGEPVGLYWRASFDERGDFVAHLDLDSMRASGQHLRVPAAEKTGEACARVSRFARRAHERGASVVIVPPPIPGDDHREQSEEIARFWNAVSSQTGVPVMNDARFTRSSFWDTAYHLTREGRQQRTEALLGAIRAVSHPSRDRGQVQLVPDQAGSDPR